jgi:HNH endonuclease
VSKEEIIAAIRKCARELGHCPSLTELTAKARVSRKNILKLFGNYGMAVRASGMEPPRGAPTPVEKLFADWAGVARELGKLPSMFEYEKNSMYSSRPLVSRFKGWRNVPAMMLAYAERAGLEEKWADVLELIKTSGVGARQGASSRGNGGPLGTGKILRDRPTYGPPMMESGMACGPENENGVLFLFGMLAWQLGFVVKKIQTGFPDWLALRKIDEQTWQDVKIEVELESRNFLRHGHPPKGCDLILCWIHNWPECPVEVVELRSVWKG